MGTWGARRGMADAPGLEHLLRLTRERARSTGFFFDFDGTLASIQDDPANVMPVDGAVDALRRLADLVGMVALVSARPVNFLASRFQDVPGLCIFGLYGLESYRDGELVRDATATAWAPVVRDLVRRAGTELPARIRVEDKGLSMAVHYRSHPDLGPVAESWGRAQADRWGMTLHLGPMTVEIAPPVQRHKGTVMAEALVGLSCAWYFGDGLPDLEAFNAITQRSARDPGFLGVRVAVDNLESLDQLRPRAEVVLDGPGAVPRFLGVVVDHLHHERGGKT